MKCSIKVSIYLILILGNGSNWINAESNYIHGPRIVLPKEETVSDQSINDLVDPVYQPQARKYCGVRLIDMLRILCRHNYNSPGSPMNSLVTNNIQVPEGAYIHHAFPQARHMHVKPNFLSSRIRGTGVIPKRQSRQVVNECCNQPCYPSTLLKYCDQLEELQSSNLESDQPNSVLKDSLSGNELSESIILNSVMAGHLSGKVEYLSSLFKKSEEERHHSKKASSPCKHKNKNKKQRRKKHRNKASPQFYVSIPMVIVPYADLSKPLGSNSVGGGFTNTYAAQQDNITNFELRGGMNDLGMISGRQSPHESKNTFGSKRIRDTHRLPSFPQRALQTASDEVQEISSNDLSPTQGNSQVQEVTDPPYAEPLFVISSQTNDQFYAH